MDELTPVIIDGATEETQDTIRSLKLNDIFNRLLYIRNQVKIQKVMEGKRIKRYTVAEVEHRALLFEAYELIQEIRYRLSGEELRYHLYVTVMVNGQETVRSIDVGGAELQQFISFNLKEIDINVAAIQKVLPEADNAQRLFAQHYSQIITEFHTTDKDSSLWLAPAWARNQYNLFKRNGSPQVYNKGHIIEALDAVDHESDDWKTIFYSQALKLDSVSGFKGGDNGMIQVKANSARLMRYNSIENAINRLLVLRDEILSGDMTKAKQTLKNMFYSKDVIKQADATINDALDKFLEQLASILKLE